MSSALPGDARSLQVCLSEARQRSLAMLDDLDDEQLWPRPSAIVNPFLWELGHVAWFQERWLLRHCAGRAPRGRD